MDITLEPRMWKGTIKEITDVGVRIGIMGRMGVLSLPKRCVCSDRELEVGQSVVFYFSYVQVVGT